MSGVAVVSRPTRGLRSNPRQDAFGTGYEQGGFAVLDEVEIFGHAISQGHHLRYAMPAGVVCTDEPIVQTDIVTRTTADDYLRFLRLMKKWREDRGVTSSITAMVMCPSYLAIIGMGEKVIPLIVQQLKLEAADPDHWFVALQAITGVDPVDEALYGDTVAMARAWIQWADAHYAG